jgi:hypothetical protein
VTLPNRRAATSPAAGCPEGLAAAQHGRARSGHYLDVVAPVQAAERAVEFGNAGGGSLISHASKTTANKKPLASRTMAAAGARIHGIPTSAASTGM